MKTSRALAQPVTQHGEYTLRPCAGLDELAACIKLQKEIWGYAPEELYPLRLFVNLTKIGGHVIGAFTPASELVGFVASMPAWRGRKRYFHSLSLGVLPVHENKGLGRALKLEQRAVAVTAGIDLIEWTFDPLRPKNAYFNIERLGAVCRRYLPDHYGVVESRLQRGLPSDRLIAEWWLDSERVRRAMAGRAPRPSRGKPAAVVEVPAHLAKLGPEHAGETYEVQRRVRAELVDAFKRGLFVTGFQTGRQAARYLLDRDRR